MFNHKHVSLISAYSPNCEWFWASKAILLVLTQQGFHPFTKGWEKALIASDGFSPDLLLLVPTSPAWDGLGDYGPALEQEGCAQTPLLPACPYCQALQQLPGATVAFSHSKYLSRPGWFQGTSSRWEHEIASAQVMMLMLFSCMLMFAHLWSAHQHFLEHTDVMLGKRDPCAQPGKWCPCRGRLYGGDGYDSDLLRLSGVCWFWLLFVTPGPYFSPGNSWTKAPEGGECFAPSSSLCLSGKCVKRVVKLLVQDIVTLRWRRKGVKQLCEPCWVDEVTWNLYFLVSRNTFYSKFSFAELL